MGGGADVVLVEIRIGDGHHALLECPAVCRQRYAAEAAQIHLVPAVAGDGGELVPVDLDLDGGLGAFRQEIRRPGVGLRIEVVRQIVVGVDIGGFDDDAPVGLGGRVIVNADHRIGGGGVGIRILDRDIIGQDQARAEIRIVKCGGGRADVPRDPELGGHRILQRHIIECPRECAHVVGEHISAALLHQILQQLGEPVVIDGLLDGGG